MRQFAQGLVHNWYAATTPTVATTPPSASLRDRLRRSRLLSHSLLVFFTTAFCCLLYTLVTGMLFGSLLISVFMGLFLFTARLNRRGQLYAAGSLFISGYILIAALGLQFASVSGDFSITYDWIDLAIVPIFAGFTLPFWTPLVFALLDIVVMVSIYSINYYHHTMHYFTMRTELFTLFAIGAFFIMAIATLAAIYARSIEQSVIEADRAIELERVNAALELAHMATSEANKRLEELATRDPVTGLLNHRALHVQLTDAVAQAMETQSPLGVIFADLDHFKQVNDTWGHKVGDITLSHLAKSLCANVRETDIVARYGGEEFIVILPQLGTTDTIQMAERLRDIVANSPIVLPDGQHLAITLSLGVAHFPDDGQTIEHLLTAADAAMYRAKHSGRNRVCVAADWEQPRAA